MNAFIISNENNDALVVATNADCELCDHTALMLCSHMTRLSSTLQSASYGIEQMLLQLQVM